MNPVSPNKLLQSKWTAVRPVRNEKHFVVIDLVRDAHDNVVQAILEAVLTRRRITLTWRDLKDDAHWQIGWK